MNALKILVAAPFLFVASMAVAEPAVIHAEGQLLLDCDATGTTLQVIAESISGGEGVQVPAGPASWTHQGDGLWTSPNHTCAEPASAQLEFDLDIYLDSAGEVQGNSMTVIGPSGVPHPPSQPFLSVVPTVDICDILDVKA